MNILNNTKNNNYIKHSYVSCAVSLFDTNKINFNMISNQLFLNEKTTTSENKKLVVGVTCLSPHNYNIIWGHIIADNPTFFENYFEEQNYIVVIDCLAISFLLLKNTDNIIIMLLGNTASNKNIIVTNCYISQAVAIACDTFCDASKSKKPKNTLSSGVSFKRFSVANLLTHCVSFLKGGRCL